ncbi:MAG: hypothetical protein ACQETH_03065 [Candidatus Rifleibacteriota bacterium]
MGSASFLTPVYLFSSISAGTGKASLLANYAVFLNNAGNKIAVIDLDSTAPLKLRNSFPDSINLQVYDEISRNVKYQQSRYQKTFFFTDTEKISIFPANKIESPESLFTDAALRDFFIQTRAAFDFILINFPSGDKYCLLTSALLEQNHLWHGNSPISLFISRPDLKSLKLLDGISRKSPAFMFQTRENALIVFNRVPQSLNEQKISDNDLTSSEIKKLFNFSNFYFIPETEEFPHQKNIAAPIVLKTNSLLKQIFSGLNRFLSSGITDDVQKAEPVQTDFTPSLDGEFLDKLSPYLYEIKKTAAVRLFTEPENIQIFLEESEDSYQIRVRLTGHRQQIIGISRQIKEKFPVAINKKPALRVFKYCFNSKILKKSRITDKKFVPEVKNKPVYRFDDRFSNSTSFTPRSGIDFHLKGNNYPSPIFFKFFQKFKEIPTLSQILGLDSKKYVKFSYQEKSQIYSIGGVTHFFIPPEFEIKIENECIFKGQIFVGLSKTFSAKITHDLPVVIAYPFQYDQTDAEFFIEDIFARNKKLEKTEETIAESRHYYCADYCTFSANLNSFSSKLSDLEEITATNEPHLELPKLTTTVIPEILPLLEDQVSEDFDEGLTQDSLFKKSGSVFKPEKKFILADSFNFLESNKDANTELFFSNKFSFLFSAPDFSFDLNLLINLKRNYDGSPGNFSQTQENKRENFLSKDFNKKELLNKKISLESQLLDYNFKFTLSASKASYKIQYLKSSLKSSNFDFKKFFPCEFYTLPISEQVPDFFTKETNRLDFLFNKPNEIFKNISLELPRNVAKYSWEVLPIYVLPNLDRSYIEPDKRKHLRTDFITDSEENQPDFTLLKSNILKLNKMPKSLINRTAISFNSISRIPAIEYIYFTGYKKPLTKIEPEFACTGPSLTESAKLKHEFKHAWNSRFVSHYDLENYDVTDIKAPKWFVPPPVIYCLPFHLQIDMLCKPGTKDQFGEIISFSPSVYDELNQHDLGFNIYSYRINYCEPEIPNKIPHRNLIFEVSMSSNNEKELIDNIKLPRKKIDKQIEKKYRDESKKIVDKFIPKNPLPQLTKGYPLYKPQFNLQETEKSIQTNLTVPAPVALDELYKHLLFCLNQQLKAPQKLFFHPLSIKPISFELKHAPFRLHFKDRVFFVRRILACKQKLGSDIDRKSFSIAAISYKDLLNLANQTGRKFNTLSNKNTS